MKETHVSPSEGTPSTESCFDEGFSAPCREVRKEVRANPATVLRPRGAAWAADGPLMHRWTVTVIGGGEHRRSQTPGAVLWVRLTA